MKKIILLFIVTFLLSVIAFGQTNNINYKAIIKDASGNVVANQSITVQFSILQGGNQTNVYQETHSPTTNIDGLIILNIGAGTIDSGDFSTINWASADHYLNVQVDITGGTTFTDLGTTQFMTVPYAFHAKTVEIEIDGSITNELQSLSVSNDSISISNGNTIPIPKQGVKGIDTGDFSTGTYSINRKRYYMELTSANYLNSVPIDHAVFTDLCGDDDGCTFTLGFKTSVSNLYNVTVSSPSKRLFYNPTNRYWRLGNEPGEVITSGRDADGTITYIYNLYDAVFLTDGHYENGAALGDSVGFELLYWTGYYSASNPDKIVKIIIDD